MVLAYGEVWLAFLLLVGSLQQSLACDFDCRGRLEDKLVTTLVKGLRAIKNSKEVVFYLYNRERPTNPERYEVTNIRPAMFSTFNANRTTKIVVHGWQAHVPSLITETFKAAYLKTGDYNLVMLDWSRSGSLLPYPWAKSYIPVVANHLATFIDQLAVRYKVRPDDLHVVGHSLGAHIAGVAGQMVSAGVIGRITGLDPAEPLLDLDDPMQALTSSAARFVDVVHTCGNLLGIKRKLGHVDFYPNGGTVAQPGCGFDISGACSHKRAYGYYSESILSSEGFLGVACPSWSDYKNGRCPDSSPIPMGEHVPTHARGNYYLRTNSREPFARSSDEERELKTGFITRIRRWLFG